MAERSLVVRLVGDERDLLRAYSRSEKATKDFGRTTDTTIAKADKRFKALRSPGAAFAGGFIASEVLSVGKTFIDQAAEAQRVLTQVKQGLENTGQSWDKYADQIENTVTAQSKLGFDDEELLATFDKFQRQTGNVTEALRLNSIAMDVARGRNISLESASTLVTKAAAGQRGALTRLGIEVDKNASKTELLAELTERYGGSAEAAADDASTAQDRLRVSLENVQETIGKALLPAVSDLAVRLAEAADGAENVLTNLNKLANAKIPVLDIPLNFTVDGKSIGDRIKDAFGSNVLPPQLRAALPFLQILGGLDDPKSPVTKNTAKPVTSKDQPIVVNTTVQVDGQTIAKVTKRYNERDTRSNPSQKRGGSADWRR